MKIAFCLHNYFPYGGMQRDFLRISRASQEKGNDIRVYTFSWEGETVPGFEIVIVPRKGLSNHSRNINFSKWVSKHRARHPVDVMVGFNKMPGLDYYFAADVCYAEKTRQEKGFFYKLTPRYRSYMRAERSVMAPTAKTHLLVLTEKQKADFQCHYHTQDSRIHMMPPGIDADRFRELPKRSSQRIQQLRTELGVGPESFLLLQVGSDFRRKGVDRSLKAIAALPEAIKSRCVFVVVGEDNPQSCQRLSSQLGLQDRVRFFSGREDINDLMIAADLLLHPAYQEAGGIVIIEAIACGLPAVVSGTCGYAPYVTNSGCGEVLAEPVTQDALNEALAKALFNDTLRKQWRDSAKAYLQQNNLYQLAERASAIIIKEGVRANP